MRRGKNGLILLPWTTVGLWLENLRRARKVAGPNWARIAASFHCCCSLGGPCEARAVRG